MGTNFNVMGTNLKVDPTHKPPSLLHSLTHSLTVSLSFILSAISSSSSSSSSATSHSTNTADPSLPPPLSISKSRLRSSYHTSDLFFFSRTPLIEGSGGGGGARYRHVSLSDLDMALGEIKELRSELKHERRMRKKVEAANRVLTREKEAAEETCRRLEEEVACLRREMERAAKDGRGDEGNGEAALNFKDDDVIDDRAR